MANESFIYGHAAGAPIARPKQLNPVPFAPPLNRRGQKKAPKSVESVLYYQASHVLRSLVTSGRVGVHRDANGTDGTSFGSQVAAVPVKLYDGRSFDFSLDEHGFQLIDDEVKQAVDFYDQHDVVENYYPQCCETVKKITGAAKVVAFDHNVRGKARALATKVGGNEQKSEQAVQGPIFGPHVDYTAASARKRLNDVASPPMERNDTRTAPLLTEDEVANCLHHGKRFTIINVWRNVADKPVQRSPLAVCEADSVSADDLVTFEVRYAERTGENYLACHSLSHRWWWFPDMTKQEALLIKNWDAAGRHFRDFGEAARTPCAVEVPSTFALHSAFEIDAPVGAADRQSIEVRTIAIYDSKNSKL